MDNGGFMTHYKKAQMLAVIAQRWQVLPDPELKGRHPCHDHRWITTLGAYFEESGRNPNEWILDRGYAICKMRDNRTAEAARLVAAAPMLASAILLIRQAVESAYVDPDLRIKMIRPIIKEVMAYLFEEEDQLLTEAEKATIRALEQGVKHQTL